MTGREKEEEKYDKRPGHRRASPWHPLREITTFLLTSKGSSVLEKNDHPLVRWTSSSVRRSSFSPRACLRWIAKPRSPWREILKTFPSAHHHLWWYRSQTFRPGPRPSHGTTLSIECSPEREVLLSWGLDFPQLRSRSSPQALVQTFPRLEWEEGE